jgi:hypothetical protein
MRAWEILAEGKGEGKWHVSPSGVKTNMPPTDDDYEINYGKKGLAAKFRKDQGMDVKTGNRKVSEAMAVREYPHPEEYLIKDGTDAGIEILQDFKEDLKQPEQLNLKWDGKAAIFWGRDETGQFYMVPNNQWNKGQKLDKEGLEGEIKRTGRKLPTQSDEEFAATRARMAAAYGAQWSMLEKSSPKQGFYWGDIMFDSTPAKNEQGEYEFTPNKITYTADPNKELGQAISRGAKVFITVHGLVPEFGSEPTSDLRPVSQEELTALNKKNSSVYLLSERPQKQSIATDTKFIDNAIKVLTANKSAVDSFISYTAPKFTGFRTILRDYINSKVKQRGQLSFDDFLAASKLSDSQKKLASDAVAGNVKGMSAFEQSAEALINAKNQVFTELQKAHGASMKDRLGISSSVAGTPGGEGFAKIRKSGGGIKYVNPEFRAAPVNARFDG